jgi:hypothetical protein
MGNRKKKVVYGSLGSEMSVLPLGQVEGEIDR